MGRGRSKGTRTYNPKTHKVVRKPTKSGGMMGSGF